MKRRMLRWVCSLTLIAGALVPIAAVAQDREWAFSVDLSDPGSEPFTLKEPQEVYIDDIIIGYWTLALAPAD